MRKPASNKRGGRQKGAVSKKLDLANTRKKVEAIYAEADRQEATLWGESIRIAKHPRKRLRRYYRGGRSYDWWSWTTARRKELAAQLGISLRTLDRHTSDLRSDQPAEVDPKHVLKNILGRLPADVLADLGIHKPTGTDDTMSAYLTRRRSVKAIAALLEVLRLASEWV